jgi:hypothetical protein
MLFAEGRHLAWNSIANDSGDAGIPDAQTKKIGPVSIFAIASRVIAMAVRAALAEEPPPSVRRSNSWPCGEGIRLRSGFQPTADADRPDERARGQESSKQVWSGLHNRSHLWASLG